MLQVFAEAFQAANSAASTFKKASMVAFPSGFLAVEMALVTAWETSLRVSVFFFARIAVGLLRECFLSSSLSLSFFPRYLFPIFIHHSLFTADVPLALPWPPKIAAGPVVAFDLSVV